MRQSIAEVGRVLVFGWSAVWASSPALAQQFPQGPCSGVLCPAIGGQQTPQKSLFPQGQCGGIFCAAIGGSQAPPHAEAPPPCGGGLFCDLNPYGMGPPVTAAETQRVQGVRASETAALKPATYAAQKTPKRTQTAKSRQAKETSASVSKPSTGAQQ